MPINVGNSNVNTNISSSNLVVNQSQSLGFYNIQRNPIRPAFLFLFATSQTVDPRINFTRASSACSYSKNGNIVISPANVPRIDYNPLTKSCNGLLLEEQRTNIMLQSGNILLSPWSTRASPSITTGIQAPDGSYNAVQWSIPTGTANIYDIYQSVSMAGSTEYSYSGYFKAAGLQWIQFQTWDFNSGGNGIAVWYDLFNGVVGQIQNSGTASGGVANIQSVGNGWYYCSFSGIYTTFATPSGPGVTMRLAATNGGGAGSNATVGFGTVAWGIQVEQGYFPTSYIPTTSGSVTRAGDFASFTQPQLFSQNGFTLGTTLTFNSAGIAGTGQHIFSISEYSNNSGLRCFKPGGSTTLINCTGTGNLSATTQVGASASFIGNSIIYASSFNTNGLLSCSVVNTGTATSSIVGSVPTFSTLQIGNDQAAGGQLNGWIQSLAYYPQAFSNLQIQTMTAV